MQYWRMQLHPSEPDLSLRYAVESVAAGVIGLEFDPAVGDLRVPASRTQVQHEQRGYVDLLDRMKSGDLVLIMAHHYPFALVTVKGEYAYMPDPKERLGVWFPHLRWVAREKTQYYGSWIKDPQKWEKQEMRGSDLHSDGPGYAPPQAHRRVAGRVPGIDPLPAHPPHPGRRSDWRLPKHRREPYHRTARS